MIPKKERRSILCEGPYNTEGGFGIFLVAALSIGQHNVLL